jgi:hypothetical protein
MTRMICCAKCDWGYPEDQHCPVCGAGLAEKPPSAVATSSDGRAQAQESCPRKWTASALAVTGRWSCAWPEVQQIPREHVDRFVVELGNAIHQQAFKALGLYDVGPGSEAEEDDEGDEEDTDVFERMAHPELSPEASQRIIEQTLHGDNPTRVFSVRFNVLTGYLDLVD